ncbi:MAG: type II toxin-antitoxin system PemK/MazF family toxin, partial [Acidobacteria bacterium]|nr:type II toxin-antitoxin system PemK/MazF family toxin [Acidobacteriota bacterium]
MGNLRGRGSASSGTRIGGVGERARRQKSRLRRGEIWWADLGAYRPQEQLGRRPVVIWQSDAPTRLLESVLVVPLTTNLSRAHLAGTAL